MKFGKSLSNQIEETLPEWRDKFLSYKDLKKRLKLIRPPPTTTSSTANPSASGEDDILTRPSKRSRLSSSSSQPSHATADECETNKPPTSSSSSSSPPPLSSEEADFIRLLEAELDKFNTFFVEKEEEYVICQKELQDRMANAANHSKDDLMKIRKEIVDFHGEMVLLENYSALNYTGLVKILKKYDKRTGALLRLPFIRNVLQQPFFTTDLIYKLVKECEAMLDRLFPANEPSASVEEDVLHGSGEKLLHEQKLGSSSLGKAIIPDLEEIEYIESLYMKSTVSALRVLKEIRKGSSTVSVFSLPPLQQNNSVDGVEDRWGVTPVLEQAAAK